MEKSMGSYKLLHDQVDSNHQGIKNLLPFCFLFFYSLGVGVGAGGVYISSLYFQSTHSKYISLIIAFRS